MFSVLEKEISKPINEDAMYWRGLFINTEEKLRKANLEISSLKSSTRIEEYTNSQLKIQLAKQKEQLKFIPQLQKNIKELEKQLNKRTSSEAPFGSNTPSSKRPYKKNTKADTKNTKGGGNNGHPGSGRKEILECDITNTIKIPINKSCECNSNYNLNSVKTRFVYRFIPSKIEIIKYEQEQGICPNCGKLHLFRPIDVLPRNKYNNQFIAHILSEHYFHGQTAGKICSRYNINSGTFFNIAHNLAKKLKPMIEKIELVYLTSLVKYADETTWSTDGMHSWAYGFFSKDAAIFRFRHTRSSSVPKDLFKGTRWNGVLLRDRYAGYNSMNCRQQYCYSHLIRNIEDLENEFPDDKEVKAFVKEILKWLKKAIKLTNKKLKGNKHRHKARIIKNKIIEIVSSEANHPGVQHFQNVFREHKNRMYQWALSHKIPAENNYAERKWRPVVIARKISFGSQSKKGRLTRETLMSFLVTADLRGYNPEEKLKELLDEMTINPEANKSFDL